MPSIASSPKIQGSAVGRRKRAIASARISPGDGGITVNGKSAKVYFSSAFFQAKLLSPLKITGNETKYNISLKVVGGGPNGQLDACVLAIARALVDHKAANKVALRNAGLMTRDSRERQRRMIGTGGKARRRKSSPKR